MFVLYSSSNPSLELLFLLDQVVQSRAATVALTVTWSWVVMTFTIIFKSVGEAATFYLLFPSFHTLAQFWAKLKCHDSSGLFQHWIGGWRIFSKRESHHFWSLNWTTVNIYNRTNYWYFWQSGIWISTIIT